jgi:hypothetical protein
MRSQFHDVETAAAATQREEPSNAPNQEGSRAGRSRHETMFIPFHGNVSATAAILQKFLAATSQGSVQKSRNSCPGTKLPTKQECTDLLLL